MFKYKISKINYLILKSLFTFYSNAYYIVILNLFNSGITKLYYTNNDNFIYISFGNIQTCVQYSRYIFFYEIVNNKHVTV